jgi:hypothetical protein
MSTTEIPAFSGFDQLGGVNETQSIKRCVEGWIKPRKRKQK